MGIISTILTVCGFGVGILLGLVAGYFMFVYFEPDDVKEPRVRSVYELDKQTVETLLPEIPHWVKNPDHEKVDWMNSFMQEMWPYLNKALSEIIRSTAEPYIETYKAQYKLDAVEFETLTLGTLPPSFVGVKVHETGENEMIFEVSVKWAGNPDIKLAVNAYGMKATAQPHVDFGLKLLNADLMSIPGLYRFVQDYIKQMIASMYLWPKTYDLPVLDAKLCRHRKQALGMLFVTVKGAKQLKNRDILGKSDPFVTLNVGDSSRKTRTIMNNLNPIWNETLKLPVDDPESETLDIIVYDWDKVGPPDKLGVQVIPLKELVPENLQSFTLKLLKNFDVNDSANQKNRGEITLELNYKPFKEELETQELQESDDGDSNGSPVVSKVLSQGNGPLVFPPGGGLLVVSVHSAEDLEGKHHTNPFVRLTFRGDQKRTKVVKKSRSPRWEEDFEYTLEDPPVNDRLLLEVCSKSSKNIIHPREALGRVEIDLSDVVKSRRINEKYQLLDSKGGKLRIELNWKSMGTLSRRRDGDLRDSSGRQLS